MEAIGCGETELTDMEQTDLEQIDMKQTDMKQTDPEQTDLILRTERDDGKIQKKKGLNGLALFLAFFSPFVIMLAIFAGNGIYPFGDRSFVVSDMYHQYLPFFQEFVGKIKAGEGIDYSWNVGMGSNFRALYAYYLASPLHWLAFLFPVAHLMEFMSYLVVVKLGLAGLSSFLYLKSRGGKDHAPFSALLFSCFYAMSGFLAAYNWNIMWLDCVVLAPLILMGMERMVHQGKMGLYVITLGLSIFSNFYISIMICLFLVLYFIFLFLTEPGKMQFLGRFILGSLLAGELAAILLVPVFYALLVTDFGDMDFPEKWKAYFSVLDILARHCMGITTEKALEHWPNIYCGAAVFLMIPLYAVNDKIPLKKRFGFLTLAGIFLLSFGTNVLDFIWHGFNYPDSLPGRQSFLYILIVLVMCHDCLSNPEGIKAASVLKTYLGSVVLFLVIEKFVDSDDFQTWTWLMNLAFVTVYAICLHFYKTRESKRAIYAVAALSFVAVLAECAVNMSLTSVGTVSRTAYFEHLEDYRALYERNAPEGDFQRFEKFSRKTKNDATLAGFPSASVFSSTMNSSVMDFYTRLGMRHSKVYYGYDGATAFSSALLNVGYLFGESDQLENEIFSLTDQENGVYLYRANYTLPFGYVAPPDFELPEGLKYNGIAVQNELAEKLGAEGTLFRKVKADDEGEDVKFTASQDGIYYGLVWDYGTKSIKALGGQFEEYLYKDLKKDCILYLGYLEKGEEIDLVNGDDDDETPNVSVAIYRLDMGVLEQALGVLSENHMTETRVDNTHVSGKISLSEEGRLITTIPYEEGWKVLVNGEVKETEKFGGAFLALELEPGDYEIEMEYTPKGKGLGIGISLLCLAVAGILFGKKSIRKIN